MPLSVDELQPYQSLLLANTPPGNVPTKFAESTLKDIERLLDLNDNGQRSLKNRIQPMNAAGVVVVGLHYVHERSPSWTSNNSITDRLNHLVLIVQRGPLVAVHFSESKWKAIVAAKFGDASFAALSKLILVSEGTLNAAFVSGAAKTLWLSGTHGQARWKADNKVLTGLDLRDALDPIEDQSFQFTAARCLTMLKPGQAVTTGINPRRSQIWIGMSIEWKSFLNAVNNIFDLIEATKTPTSAPLPVVAVSTNDPTGVTGAYGIAAIPAELSEENDVDASVRQRWDEYAAKLFFDVVSTSGANATVNVYLESQLRGKVMFALLKTKTGRVQLTVTGTPNSNSNANAFEDIVDFCKGHGHIKIWYESGHTYANESIFEERFRDISFAFDFADFYGFDLKKEKPAKNKHIGADDSLFCWVLNKWAPARKKGTAYKQYLGCDDGAHEKADFVCLELIDGKVKLTLLHVKAVHTTGKVSIKRQISVSNYEVVVGQAVKNIRWIDRLARPNPADLDPKRLDEKLSGAIKVAWEDGHLITQTEFTKAVKENLKLPFESEVVVVQPQVTDVAVSKAKSGYDRLRLNQLYTLLNQGKAAAANVGAQFTVIGEHLPAAIHRNKRKTP
jgi:hypothetical protein